MDWVIDDDRARSFDGKKLLIKGRGIFKMRISEVDSSGERNPGFVLVLIDPYDLDAAMNSK